jgi:hypothetical protein
MNKAETKDPHSKDLIFNKVPNKDKNQPLLNNNKTKTEINIKIEEVVTSKDNKEEITKTEEDTIKTCSSNNPDNKIEGAHIKIDNKEEECNNKTITTIDNNKVRKDPNNHNKHN